MNNDGGVRMNEKKLGVLGGMGPMATSVFFDKLIKHTDAEKDQDHIDTIILNHATLPDRTESILEHKKLPFLNAVKKDLELFETAGVENIAIPCNTSHYFYNDIQSMTSIHVINMVEVTVKYIAQKYGTNSKIGVLATNGTIESGVYEKACQLYNLKSHQPKADIQNRVMGTIYNIKADSHYEAPELETIINGLITEEGCHAIILGCTELSCVPLSNDLKKYCIDPLELLVHESIVLSGKQPLNPFHTGSFFYHEA